MIMATEGRAAQSPGYGVTAGHGCSWTTVKGRVETLRNKHKRVHRNQEVYVNVDRKCIGVRSGQKARIVHIMVPDRRVGPYAGHVLVLNFGNKKSDGHFFALSEVTPICES
jgi:hypothetical protein